MAPRKLQRYRERRDFARTGEPEGRDGTDAGNRFVVHKHHATADHYDLRLQVGDVLKCWAVPKGPSLDPAEKRLAVETEDHPLDYADFEGVIPKGEYGGGPMIVWDSGVWAPMDDVETSLATGAFKFRLAGEKLHGGWMLARLKAKDGETKPAWLLFKERDAAADPGTDILAARPESVQSGRLIEDLLAREAPAAPTRLRLGSVKGAVRADMPDRVAPQLASAMAEPPDGDDWLHEIKYDGYRTLAHLSGGTVRMLTRKGLDWTHRYRALASALGSLPCRLAVLDGEVVVLDAQGVSGFGALQDALSRKADGELVYFAFDLLYLNGWDLREAPLARRKALLAALVAGGSRVQYSDHVEGSGGAFFGRVSEMGLEGVVSKRAGAPYRSGRSHSWTKSKARLTGDFVIAGFTVSEAAEGLAALAVAEWQDGALAWRGKVGTGFDARTAGKLKARLEGLRDGGPPLEGAPRDIRWVRPVLTAHVHYAGRTRDGLLRHAVFKGLREVQMSKSAPSPRRRLISDADLAGVSITNPTRRMFGPSGATKLDIAVYYAAIGDAMLPQILGRPVSLVRCPTGRAADCFFQRHAFTGMPDTVARVETRNSDDEQKTYLAVDDAKGYLALAQFGVVEFHIWGTLTRRLETPDRLIFDLDPGKGITWRNVVSAARYVRQALEGVGLLPFVKTTGGRGLHVVVPIRPKRGWKALHAGSKAIAEQIAAAEPGTFTTTMGEKNRAGRIFIDFHRNARGATAVAPYSLRARPRLPAATPVNWSDLDNIDAPEDLNYSSLPDLVSASGDPWAGIDASARDLPD